MVCVLLLGSPLNLFHRRTLPVSLSRASGGAARTAVYTVRSSLFGACLAMLWMAQAVAAQMSASVVGAAASIAPRHGHSTTHDT